MQIAKMFASLGFNVDLSGLSNFKSSLAIARGEMTNLGRGTKQTTQQLRGLSRALDSIDSRLNRIKGSAVNKTIRDGYNDIASSVRRIDTAFQSITNNQKHTTKALGKIHAGVKAGVPLWDKYKESVLAVRDALRQVNARLVQIRGNAQIRVRLGSGGTGGNGGGGGGNPSNNRRSSSNGFDLTGGGFFRSMMPATAIAGGLTSAGYFTKEIVQRGREQQKMENVLMFSSKTNDNLVDFNDSLQFVRKTALELGTTSQELGKAFAQVNMSAGDTLNKGQKKELFHDMAKSFVTMGASQDEQFLLYKAVNQMFSLGRIQAEEMNQLTGQGLVPRQMVYEAVKEVYGVKTNKEVASLQKNNMLDPARILPHLFKAMSGQADSSGAFKKYQESSLFQQNNLTEKSNQMSQMIMDGGLDKALAGIFKSLSEILVVLEEITLGFKTFKLALDDVTSGNGLLTIGLTILVGILFKKRQMLVGILRNLTSFSGIMRIITGFMNGRFGQALLLLIKRFGFVGLAISGVILLMQKIGEAMKARTNGEWTWIDTLIVKFKIFKNHLDLTLAKLRLFFHNGKLSVDPLWWSNGNVEQIDAIGQAKSGGSEYNLVMKKQGAEYNKSVEQTKKALDNMQNQKPPQIPYAPTQEIPKIQVPSFQNLVSVNINGIPVPQRQISISEAINA